MASETSVQLHNTAGCHNQEDYKPNNPRRENQKTCTLLPRTLGQKVRNTSRCVATWVIPSKREFCTQSLRPIVFFSFSFNRTWQGLWGGVEEKDSTPWDSLRLPLLATITIYKDDLCSLKWRGQEGKITRRRTKWVSERRWCFSLDEMGHTKKTERE